ncbi:DUF6436 domain-containing protein [Eionea flava]
MLKKLNIILFFLVIGLSLIITLIVRQQYIVPAVENSTFFEASEKLETLFLSNNTHLLTSQRDSSNAFDREINTLDKEEAAIKVVYFWQDDCPCDQFTQPHFALLANEYRQVVFYLASINGEVRASQWPSVKIFPTAWVDIVRSDIQATPAVGIWDASGQLVYFGPHSLGYICNNDTSFVKKIIDALLNQQSVSASSVLGDGCFCRVNHN